MKYSVIGTGAVGGFYGSKLANAGFALGIRFQLHADGMQKFSLFFPLTTAYMV